MVKKIMKPGSQVKVDFKVDFEDTFSYKLHTYLTLEEIQDLIDMQELSQNSIVVYMRYDTSIMLYILSNIFVSL